MPSGESFEVIKFNFQLSKLVWKSKDFPLVRKDFKKIWVTVNIFSCIVKKKHLINLITCSNLGRFIKVEYSKKIRFTLGDFQAVVAASSEKLCVWVSLKRFVWEFLSALQHLCCTYKHNLSPLREFFIPYEKKKFLSFLISLDSYFARFSSLPIRK